jgi:hypothetical protein
LPGEKHIHMAENHFLRFEFESKQKRRKHCNQTTRKQNNKKSYLNIFTLEVNALRPSPAS